jgi:hypothetical protein
VRYQNDAAALRAAAAPSSAAPSATWEIPRPKTAGSHVPRGGPGSWRDRDGGQAVGVPMAGPRGPVNGLDPAGIAWIRGLLTSLVLAVLRYLGH